MSPISRPEAIAGAGPGTVDPGVCPGPVEDGEVVGIHWGQSARPMLESHAQENAGYWRGVLLHGPETLAENLRTRPGLVWHRNRFWPLTRNERVEGNSYPCSLHTQYVAYPRTELGLVPSPVQRRAVRGGLALFDVLLRAARVDRVVQWSSWLWSTNLHGPELREAVRPVTRALVAAFPCHAILLKNVHGFEPDGVAEALIESGYDLVTSRQIYLFDGRRGDFLAKSTLRRDLREFAGPSDYRVVEHDELTARDVPRIADLYRQLYVGKHSPLNPRYSEKFVALALRERWLEFRGLRHRNGELHGVYGCFSAGETTSTPFIGYDLRQPADAGLYRRLVCRLLSDVAERGRVLNYSSGAGEFKRRRGGQPVIEFNALYTRHLPAIRRLAYVLLREAANRLARGFLERQRI